MKISKILVSIFTFFTFLSSFGQATIGANRTNLLGQELNPLQTAVPFLGIITNARSAAMGDMGVATSADENSAFHNPGKLCLVERDFGASISYNPWLRNLAPDMALYNIAGYYKLRKEDAIAVNFTYFDLGKIDFYDDVAYPLGIGTPQELSLAGTYSRLLSKKLSGGISLKYIYSNLLAGFGGPNAQSRAGQSAAADIGFYYNTDFFAAGKDMKLTVGIMINNIGGKLSYGINNRADYLPTTLKLGTMHTTELDEYNKISFGIEASKLLTPSPQFNSQGARFTNTSKSIVSAMLGSFGDAPGGFAEEIREIAIGTGAEYWYDNMFAVRGGYFHESTTKGGRQYVSLGLGIKYSVIGLDFAYLVATTRNSPLANSLRFSLNVNIEKPSKVKESAVE